MMASTPANNLLSITDSMRKTCAARLEQKFRHRLARLPHQMASSDGSALALAVSRSSGESEAESRNQRR
jgi:hypothetical protein